MPEDERTQPTPPVEPTPDDDVSRETVRVIAVPSMDVPPTARTVANLARHRRVIG